MEQQLFAGDQATALDISPASAMDCSKTSALRCALPLGKPMACGDARHREDWAADREVISGAARSRDVWLVRSGILRLQRHAFDGRRQILSLFLPGEIVGFEGEVREEMSVETATQCSLCRIDRRWLDRMLDQNDIFRAELFRQKQGQLDRLYWLTWSLGALKPEERLCAFLALSTKFMPYQLLPDGSGILSMDLPRKDIADLLGTTVESISRIISRLFGMGIIEIKDPSHFRILDMDRLIEIGQFDGFLDRMAVGPVTRLTQIEELAKFGPNSPVCFCGR